EGLTSLQKRQVAAAKGIRRAREGTLWGMEPGNTFDEVQYAFTVRPNYRINDQLSVYASLGYNEKPGFSQTPDGLPYTVEEETSNSYELGLQTSLLDGRLDVRAAVFQSV